MEAMFFFSFYLLFYFQYCIYELGLAGNKLTTKKGSIYLYKFELRPPLESQGVQPDVV